MKTAIHWFRRDLRITDNTALLAARDAAEEVLPVYVASDWQRSHRWTGANRQAFLCGSLKSLDGNLRSIGSRLHVRRGDAVDELLKLAKESGAAAIYTNRDPDPFGRGVEDRLARAAQEQRIEFHALQDVCVFERDAVLTGSGEPYKVFTPYSRAWLKKQRPTSGPRIQALKSPTNLPAGDLPELGDWKLSNPADIIEPEERAANERLKRFLQHGIARYAEDRNTPHGSTTSRISQDLRWGLLSIRKVVERCEEFTAGAPPDARKSAQTFLTELIWREFYMQLLWHFPDVLEQEFSEKYRGLPWSDSDAAFQKWCDGETGFPIVDAAMRQLRATGFMHNRARMITAMFLTKDLHIDWRRGEQYFMQHLTDGEIASNNGGWQWSAGTGADAAPYFRIQNPWTQSKRYDPDGEYIKTWIPELKNVPARQLHEPPEDGRPVATGYPAPMLDHAKERDRTLDRFKKHLSGAS